jgi:hypothetical protein
MTHQSISSEATLEQQTEHKQLIAAGSMSQPCTLRMQDCSLLHVQLRTGNSSVHRTNRSILTDLITLNSCVMTSKGSNVWLATHSTRHTK